MCACVCVRTSYTIHFAVSVHNIIGSSRMTLSSKEHSYIENQYTYKLQSTWKNTCQSLFSFISSPNPSLQSPIIALLPHPTYENCLSFIPIPGLININPRNHQLYKIMHFRRMTIYYPNIHRLEINRLWRQSERSHQAGIRARTWLIEEHILKATSKRNNSTLSRILTAL